VVLVRGDAVFELNIATSNTGLKFVDKYFAFRALIKENCVQRSK